MIRQIIAAPSLYPIQGLSNLLRVYESTYSTYIDEQADKFSKAPRVKALGIRELCSQGYQPALAQINCAFTRGLKPTALRTRSKKKSGIKGLIIPYGPYMYTAGVQTVTFGSLARILKLSSVTFLFISESETFSNKNIGIFPYTGWETPLGVVNTDNELIYELSKEPDCKIIERFSEREVSIEVQLPFLQYYLSKISFNIVALAIPKGESYERLTTLIDHYCKGNCIPIVCSNVAAGNNPSRVEQVHGIANKFIPMLDTITVQNECESSFPGGILALMQYARRKKLRLDIVSSGNSVEFGDTRKQKEGYSSFFLY